MEEINELKERLLRSIKESNADAGEKWEDYKMIELFSLKKLDSCYQLELSIGDFEKSFFTVNVKKDFWKIVDKFLENKRAEKILERFIHYTVLPLL